LAIAAPEVNVAQVNIALARAPIGAPLMAEFAALLDPINQLADQAPGFVWRLQTEEGNATGVRAFDDDRVIVNMSVWESIDQLAEFVYRSGHLEVMRRRREWFQRIRLHMVLWWVPVDHVPSVADAENRLAHLHAHGPTAHAFTFKDRFAAADGEFLIAR
jgi:uncharacterized protein DUF3291